MLHRGVKQGVASHDVTYSTQALADIAISPRFRVGALHASWVLACGVCLCMRVCHFCHRSLACRHETELWGWLAKVAVPLRRVSCDPETPRVVFVPTQRPCLAAALRHPSSNVHSCA